MADPKPLPTHHSCALLCASCLHVCATHDPAGRCVAGCECSGLAHDGYPPAAPEPATQEPTAPVKKRGK